MDEQTTKLLVEILAKQDATLAMVAGLAAHIHGCPVEGYMEKIKEVTDGLTQQHLAFLKQIEQG